MTRRGKIARLPRAVREELNRRLLNGETGARLVAWLNGHPETKRVLAEGAPAAQHPATPCNPLTWRGDSALPALATSRRSSDYLKMSLPALSAGPLGEFV